MAFDKKKYSRKTLKKLFNVGVFMTGVMLIIEHYFVWNRIDFFDFFGHEWLGIVIMLLGLYLMTSFKWDKAISPFRYAWEKFK